MVTIMNTFKLFLPWEEGQRRENVFTVANDLCQGLPDCQGGVPWALTGRSDWITAETHPQADHSQLSLPLQSLRKSWLRTHRGENSINT